LAQVCSSWVGGVTRESTHEVITMTVKNSAFLFIKPHAVTDQVKELVDAKLKEKGLRVVKRGTLKSEVIDKKKLIDNHYYAIASKATILKPNQLNVPADKFKGQFGIDWQEALDSGKVFNAMDGCAFLGVDAEKLDTLWGETKKAGKLIKFGGGFYCAEVEHDGKKAYIFNGFFMSMRSAYVEPGKSIFYYVVEWDAAKLSWKDFRSNVCGPTDPSEAPADSLRGAVFAKWEELGLTEKPNTGLNAIHASASPFEALAERMNWLNFKLDQDRFGSAMLAAGLPPRTIREWGRDPQVELGEGKKGSLFDALEDIDADECISKAADLWTINRPRPTGRVSGVEYDFTNVFAQILGKKMPCFKVYESTSVLAFLDLFPVCPGHTVVIPKALGFPTFMDMPADKAGDLTKELPKIAKAVKEATGADAVNILQNSGADAGQTVFHPHFHIIPRKAGDKVVAAPKPGAALTADAAKDVLAKVDAALHPLKKPKFGKVAGLKPDSSGVNLQVCVTSDETAAETKMGKGFDVTVGDASASVVVFLSESQKGALTKGKTYVLRNAGCKMVAGHIRLIVDKWGKIEPSEDTVEASGAKNVSDTEYELKKK